MAGGGGRVFGGANFGKDTFTTGAKNSIQALPKGGLSIGVISGTINIPGVGEVANLGVLARAMQTKGGSNVPTPNLLTLDNEPASIMVGKTVPFVSGQYITPGSTNSNPFQTIQREDIGLKLNIRPQISEGGTVKLDIYQEVSSIDRTADVAAGLVTNKRAMDTSVLLDDSQIMVLGGLLEDSVTNSRTRCRCWARSRCWAACSADTRGRSKTNLMVFLRPYVVRDSAGGMGLTRAATTTCGGCRARCSRRTIRCCPTCGRRCCRRPACRWRGSPMTCAPVRWSRPCAGSRPPRRARPNRGNWPPSKPGR